MALSQFLETPIYWAGPQAGYRYELSRTTKGDIYVRYLPHGTPAGATDRRFRIVATYPFGAKNGAFEGIRAVARGKAIVGPGGSIYYGAGNQGRKNVYLAFRGIKYQIEVYGPDPTLAARVASSGQVRPVTG